jgi:voltage-gated potassium channel
MADSTDSVLDQQAGVDDPTGRLAIYLARTQTPLDILAILTLWIVIVPPGDFGPHKNVALAIRVCLSGVYALDITMRTMLARRHLHYLASNWLSLVVVGLPPLRVVFSFRLVRAVFRRGNLIRFLGAALLLVLNGAIAVYFYERGATGSNIHTLGDSVWWALVTVTTVGYGDYYPVTTFGRIAAVLIMAIGLLTLAVVTAQVASSFVDQNRRSPDDPTDASDPVEVSLADVAERLARIEVLLSSLTPETSLRTGAGARAPGGRDQGPTIDPA